MRMIKDNRSTQVSTDDRVREIEKHIEQLNAEMARQAEVQSRHDDRITAIEDFIGHKNSVTDKRKLRLI